jgi:Crp-like helix-turn-helix domain
VVCGAPTVCRGLPSIHRGGLGGPAFQFERKASGEGTFANGEFRQRRKAERVITKVSQATLAEMVGTTRSRVSVFMNKFRKLGLINYNGDLEVHNSLLSMVLHETPAIKADNEAEAS